MELGCEVELGMSDMGQMWVGCASDVVGRVSDVIRCGSDVGRMWVGCGSGVVRMWVRCGSDVGLTWV